MNQRKDAFQAVRDGDRERLREILRADPDLADARNEEGVSLLLQALYAAQPGIAADLEKARSGIDIHEAAALGRPARVRELLEMDPEAANSWSADGFTPLHLAAFFGHTEVAESLLAGGADPRARARNPMQVHPLHSAVAGGRREVVEVLLEGGADPNARQQGGYTPLMGAASGGDGNLVRLLLEHRADPVATSDDGKTARTIAEARGHRDLLPLL